MLPNELILMRQELGEPFHQLDASHAYRSKLVATTTARTKLVLGFSQKAQQLSEYLKVSTGDRINFLDFQKDTMFGFRFGNFKISKLLGSTIWDF